jgi:hypothetical protein
VVWLYVLRHPSVKLNQNTQNLAMRLSTTFAAAFLLSVAEIQAASNVVISEYKYCIRYFGSVRAELDVPNIIPTFNYNGTIRCPRSWRFPTVSGVTLTLCPPNEYGESWNKRTDGVAITALLSLQGRTGGLLDLPIDNILLDRLLVTNGSVSGPFSNSGKPAVLAEDVERTRKGTGLPVWTINGTQSSIIGWPEKKSKAGIYFSCTNMEEKDKFGNYCGVSYDDYGAGCWNNHAFSFSMQSPLNYTIRFDNHTASVEMWAENEFAPNGTSTGSFTKVFVVFGGLRDLPSVTNFDFWKNSEQNYEVEKSELRDFSFIADEKRMPVFVNNSDTSVWFSTANNTFSANTNAAGRPETGVLIWLAVVSLVYALW